MYLIITLICMIISILLLNNEANVQLKLGENSSGVTQSEYATYLEDIQELATKQGTVSIFQNEEQSFSSRNIRKTAIDMKKMQDVVIESNNDIGVNLVVESTYVKFVVMFMMIFAVYIIFFKEKDGIYLLIKTMPNGNKNTYISKIFVLLINSFIINLILLLITAFVASKYGGYGDVLRSIQSVRFFISCDIKCNVLEMLILLFFLRFIGAFTFSLFVSALALKINNSILFIFTTLISIAANYLLTLIPYQSGFVILKYLNLIHMFDPCESFSTYKNINILNYPINLKYILIFANFIIITVIFKIGLTVFKKNDLTAKKINIKKYLKCINAMEACKSVFTFELYKTSFLNKAIIILIVFIAIEMIVAVNIEYYKSPEDYYYSNYIDILQGELTEDKIDYIENEKNEIAEAEQRIVVLNERYDNGDISLTQLQNELKRNQYSENRKSAFQKILSQYEYIIENPNAQFIYETGYEKIFNVGEDNKFFGFADFGVILTLIALFSISTILLENKSGMNVILNSTPSGTKKTIISKFLVSVLYTMSLVLITFTEQLFIIYKNYGLKNVTAPLCSLQKFACVQNLTIIAALIVKLLLICCLCFLATALFLWTTYKIVKKHK